jgi:hypothetical protein
MSDLKSRSAVLAEARRLVGWVEALYDAMWDGQQRTPDYADLRPLFDYAVVLHRGILVAFDALGEESS